MTATERFLQQHGHEGEVTVPVTKVVVLPSWNSRPMAADRMPRTTATA
ncbi:hypothetical protein ACFRI7_02800 [Streptomyces sp. NPDC056716]